MAIFLFIGVFMNEFERFIPITKVDDEERMVYGFASTPTLDSDNEIITLEAVKNALPAYLQFPTLRVMHQPIVAGTVKSTDIRTEGEQGLYIGAKVIDDNAWRFVKEGGYRGFSVGGHVTKKVGNVISGIELVEISLVDVPANKKAKIEVWKSGKLSKDAETVWSLANVMIQLDDCIDYMNFLGKDTKDLVAALESIKAGIVVEAKETENESQDAQEEMWGPMSMSKNPDDLKKVIASLDRVKFENPVAEVLRKVVKFNMQEKLEKEDAKVETPKDGEEKVEVATPTEVPAVEVVTPAAEEKVETKEEKKEEVEVTPVVEAKVEVEPQKTEEKSADITLAKLGEVTKSLEVLNETLTKTAKDKDDLSKVVAGFSENITKMNSIVEDLAKRVAVIENVAQPLKSKASYLVNRDGITKADATKDPESPISKLLAEKAELDKVYEAIGANEFAKQGYAAKAGKLYADMEKLNA